MLRDASRMCLWSIEPSKPSLVSRIGQLGWDLVMSQWFRKGMKFGSSDEDDDDDDDDDDDGSSEDILRLICNIRRQAKDSWRQICIYLQHIFSPPNGGRDATKLQHGWLLFDILVRELGQFSPTWDQGQHADHIESDASHCVGAVGGYLFHVVSVPYDTTVCVSIFVLVQELWLKLAGDEKGTKRWLVCFNVKAVGHSPSSHPLGLDELIPLKLINKHVPNPKPM